MQKSAGMLVETGKAFVGPSAMMTQMREDSAMMTQMRETQQTQPKHWLLQFKLCYFYTETLFMRFS